MAKKALHPRFRFGIVIALIVLVYCALAKYGLSLAFAHRWASPVWPAAGFAQAVLLILGTRYWVGVAIGAFVSNLLAFSEGTLTSVILSSGLIALGNLGEAVLATELVRRGVPSKDFLQRPQWLVHWILATLMGTLVASVTGPLSLHLFRGVPFQNFAPIWFTWWFGDLVGCILITPFLVAWTARAQGKSSFVEGMERIIAQLGFLAFAALVFGVIPGFGRMNYSLGFVLLPPLVLVCFRHGLRAFTLAVLPLSLLAIHGTLRGYGPFNLPDMNLSLLHLQAFLGVTCLTGLALCSALVVHRRTEDRLRDSETLYQSLVDTLPLHIFRKDRLGRFTFVNRAFARSLNCTPETVIGKTDYDFYPPDLVKKYRSDDLLVLESGETFQDIERNRDVKGRWFFMHVLKAPVRDGRGHTIGIQGIALDVTERKLAEERLKITATELARSNEELKRFAYLASHDLQEPLRTISCYCGLLEKNFGGRLGPNEDYLNFVIDAAKRMQALIAALLDYSRVGRSPARRAVVNLSKLVDEVTANLSASIEDTEATIETENLGEMVGDPTLLALLLQNLVANALKFRGAAPPKISIVHVELPNEWALSVKDNGIGIESQYHRKIFQIFQRLHSGTEFPGTGIGLAICKRIAEAHGGRISLESESGKGSCFTAYFPRVMPERSEVRPRQREIENFREGSVNNSEASRVIP